MNAVFKNITINFNALNVDVIPSRKPVLKKNK